MIHLDFLRLLRRIIGAQMHEAQLEHKRTAPRYQPHIANNEGLCEMQVGGLAGAHAGTAIREGKVEASA